MNIAVAIRLMPKAGDELEVDPSGTDIDRELVDMVISEFDDQALEEAVLIKEATGATLTAVTFDVQRISRRETSARMSSTLPAATTCPCESTTTRSASASASSR